MKEENFNAIDVSMNINELYVLSGRSIDVLSGDKEAIQLNKYKPVLVNPGSMLLG